MLPYPVLLVMELLMVFGTIVGIMAFVSAMAWRFWYYVVACEHPIGLTVLTDAIVLWLVCGGLLAII